MLRLVRSSVAIFLTFLVVCFATSAVLAQDSPPKADVSSFFAGTVVELSSQKITVLRSVLGKTSERRTFLLEPETKVEGKLRVKARVTVRFVTRDEGDVATSILVRSSGKKG